MEISELVPTIANFLTPFIPYLLKGGKEAAKVAAQDLGKRFSEDSWNLAKALLERLKTKSKEKSDVLESVKKIASNPKSKKAKSDFSDQLKLLLEQNQAVTNELLRIVKRGQKMGVIQADKGSFAAGRDIKGNTIITGSVTIRSDSLSKSDANLSELLNTIKKNVKTRSTNSTEFPAKAEVYEDTGTHERKRLADAIDTYVGNIKLQVELARKAHDADSPYKALLEYDIRDVSLFFGRDDAIKDLLKVINRSRLAVLHAQSGAGKSSLLKAGIRPQLLANGLLPIYVRPQQHPVDLAIKRSILPQLEQSPAWIQATLHDFLQEIANLIRKRLVIILDQFEEVFTLQSQTLRKQFSEQLALCLNDDLLPVHWVISVRGEKLSELATLDPPVTDPINNTMVLQALTRENANLAIREPARKRGVLYEDGLIDSILDELGPEKIHPPELQIICSALYETRKDQKLITHKIYDALGRGKGILQEHFNSVMNQKIPKDRVGLAHQVLSLLISSDGTRLSRTKDDLLSKLVSHGEDVTLLEDVLVRLVDGHLLRVEETMTSQHFVVTYELAHEYLIDKIELDPVLQDRKISQELIDYKTRNYVRNKKLTLSSDEISFISPHEKWIYLTDLSKELISISRGKIQWNRINIIFITVALTSIFFVFLYSRINSISASTPPQAVVNFSGGISLVYFFWMWVFLFAFIGGMRGWAKELLVTFSAILALAISHVLRKYVPLVSGMDEWDINLFWARVIILGVLVYFGYQTVVSVQHLASQAVRERMQDSLIGVLLGGVNGYLIAGSVLYYMHVAAYPFPQVISAPTEPLLMSTINLMMLYMPPALLDEPGIYFAIIIAFVFVIVVYAGDEEIVLFFKKVEEMISRIAAEFQNVRINK